MTLTAAAVVMALAAADAEPDTLLAREERRAPAATADADADGTDYLVHPPVLTLSARAGASFPMADSDFFDFVTDEFTVRPRDFDGALVTFDLAVHLSPYADFIAGLSYTHGTADSRYRHLGEPVEQWTRIQQTPVTAGLRFFPLGRGRQVGEFVWIPSTVRPYVGAAAGVVFYRLVQDGEWVDIATNEIFEERFESDGWGRALHALAGVEVRITPRFGLALEGRYQGASAELQDPFEGFEPLDLHGVHLTLGLSYAF